MEPLYPPPLPPPYTPARRGMPVWVWILIGCGCGVPLLFVPIVAAILFPVFQQARERAREQSCQSNLKQIGLAVAMYAQDYDQRLPLAKDWMDRTDAYIRNRQVYRCPALHADPSAFGYAYNRELSGLEMTKLPSPVTTPLVYDSLDLSRNASDPVSSLPNPGRHLGGNNVVFADGRAKRISASQIRGLP